MIPDVVLEFKNQRIEIDIENKVIMIYSREYPGEAMQIGWDKFSDCIDEIYDKEF